MRDIAFYAPMKPPGHPVPSGDRAMARALIRALEWQGAARVVVASSLRTREAEGSPEAQAALIAQAEAEAARLIDKWRSGGPDLWITYHNYYKAPDLIGPAVCAALGLPYVLIEASRARSRLSGPWARFAAAAEAATDAAQLVFYMTEQDHETLERLRPPGQALRHLRPFLDRESLPAAAQDDPGGAILSVGMMRAGDKEASYGLIAETLPLLATQRWRLDIVGDGPVRARIAERLAGFGARLRFLGQLNADEVAACYATSGIFFWPGVNEAYGLVYLEAQAHGLPVVAQDRPGLRDVLPEGSYPAPEAGPAAMAARLDALLTDADARKRAGQAGRANVAARHLLPAAAETLADGLTALGARR